MFPLKAVLCGLGLVATAVVDAAPVKTSTNPNGQVTVYWGQNAANGAVEHSKLASYCNTASGIDNLVLAFLSTFGNGKNYPQGGFDRTCQVGRYGGTEGCAALGSAITTCQSRGVKVFVSLGGALGDYGLKSRVEAKKIGQNLWDAYGNSQFSSNASTPRPFGTTLVDGWDFDIEKVDGTQNQYYPDLIAQLRSNFNKDSSHTYYITGAPQCPVPEPNMGTIIQNAQFDYLWIQYYNNPSCSPSTGTFNYDAWKQFTATTASKNAKLFIGVPASKYASTGTSTGSEYFLLPVKLASIVNKYDTDSTFGGIMMYSAAYFSQSRNNGCSYAQQAASILKTGKPCPQQS